MAINQGPMGGYDCQWMKEPPDDLKCLICLEVARDPYQHGDSECGKIFCASCISEYQRHRTACPNCRRDLTLFKDAKSARHIRALVVNCDNLDNGCEWMGELGELDGHLQSCDHALIPCTNECSYNNQIIKILRMDLDDHLANTCPRRQYECPLCEEMGEYQEIKTTHFKSCPMVRVACPNMKCQVSTPRCEASAHQSVCEYEPMPCKYAEIGCEERPLRKDLKKHEEDAPLHLQMTCDKVLELSKKMAELASQQSMAAVAPRLSKLTNFQKYMTEKEMFYSSPFYTSRSGYKMCVSVYVSGWGSGEDTHVSVGAYLMKGDNDDSLTWPFTGTVTFELLNQLEDKNHYQESVTFPADGENSKRVTGEEGERASNGYGWAKFVSHAELDCQPDKNCQYLKNDTLVFRVSVLVTDSHPTPWLVCTD